MSLFSYYKRSEKETLGQATTYGNLSMAMYEAFAPEPLQLQPEEQNQLNLLSKQTILQPSLEYLEYLH